MANFSSTSNKYLPSSPDPNHYKRYLLPSQPGIDAPSFQLIGSPLACGGIVSPDKGPVSPAFPLLRLVCLSWANLCPPGLSDIHISLSWALLSKVGRAGKGFSSFEMPSLP